MGPSLARWSAFVWYPEIMTPSAPTIVAPPCPVSLIRTEHWNRARTPEQWRQAVAGEVEPESLALFLLGSQSAGGRRTRRALLNIRNPHRDKPADMCELLGAVSRNPNQVWGQLLKYGSQACTHPVQAWRLLAAWAHTNSQGDSARTLLLTTQYELSDSLETQELSTRDLNKTWRAVESIGERINNVQWLFLLSGLKDTRLLEKQAARSSPEQRAAAGWTGLFNLHDNERILRLLHGADLMDDAHYREFIPQVQSALEQEFKNVPDDAIYDLTKRIVRLGRALDRMVEATGTWPTGDLDRFVRTMLAKGGKHDFPHLLAWVQRERLTQMVEGKVSQETHTPHPGKL